MNRTEPELYTCERSGVAGYCAKDKRICHLKVMQEVLLTTTAKYNQRRFSTEKTPLPSIACQVQGVVATAQRFAPRIPIS
jgi:hypothetical protein